MYILSWIQFMCHPRFAQLYPPVLAMSHCYKLCFPSPWRQFMLCLGLSSPKCCCCYPRPNHHHACADWQGQNSICTLSRSSGFWGSCLEVQDATCQWILTNNRQERNCSHFLSSHWLWDIVVHTASQEKPQEPSKFCVCTKLMASLTACHHYLISLLPWLISLIPSLLFSWACAPKGLTLKVFLSLFSRQLNWYVLSSKS